MSWPCRKLSNNELKGVFDALPPGARVLVSKVSRSNYYWYIYRARCCTTIVISPYGTDRKLCRNHRERMELIGRIDFWERRLVTELEKNQLFRMLPEAYMVGYKVYQRKGPDDAE